jgi:hypothetical protein
MHNDCDNRGGACCACRAGVEMAKDPKWEPITLHVDFVEKATERALLVEIKGENYWIPKSQMKDGTEIEDEGDEGALVIPRWLAEEKELVE